MCDCFKLSCNADPGTGRLIFVLISSRKGKPLNAANVVNMWSSKDRGCTRGSQIKNASTLFTQIFKYNPSIVLLWMNNFSQLNMRHTIIHLYGVITFIFSALRHPSVHVCMCISNKYKQIHNIFSLAAFYISSHPVAFVVANFVVASTLGIGASRCSRLLIQCHCCACADEHPLNKFASRRQRSGGERIIKYFFS